jgi:hypothetical protein
MQNAEKHTGKIHQKNRQPHQNSLLWLRVEKVVKEPQKKSKLNSNTETPQAV